MVFSRRQNPVPRVSHQVELISFSFILPSALFSGNAGHLADVYSKRTISVAVKVFEIAIMLFALEESGYIGDSWLTVSIRDSAPITLWRLAGQGFAGGQARTPMTSQ